MGRQITDILLPDLSAARVMVTGASDGIGIGIARRLAAAGAELLMPVRNASKGQIAVDRIVAETPDARVRLLELDLASLDSVAALGATLNAQGEPINLLINNAGVMTPPSRQVTQDGFELQFGTNHLGHFALVAHLFPLLLAGRARVTSQVSIVARSGGIHWDDLNWERSYSGMGAYKQSKIGLGLLGLELERRSRANGWGISSNLSHPGVAPTSLLSARPEVGRGKDSFSARAIRWFSRNGILMGTLDSAPLPALLAATAPDLPQQLPVSESPLFGPSGPAHFGGPPGEQALYPPLRSAEEAARLWTASETMTGVKLG